jgi:hypothetical protein
MPRYIDGDALNDYCRNEIAALEVRLKAAVHECESYIHQTDVDITQQEEQIEQEADSTKELQLHITLLETRRDVDSAAHDKWIPVERIRAEMAVLRTMLEQIALHQEGTAV